MGKAPASLPFERLFYLLKKFLSSFSFRSGSSVYSDSTLKKQFGERYEYEQENTAYRDGFDAFFSA